jgi:hypothetical protein
VSALFRPEAVEGQRESWLGDVRLVRPLSLTVLTAFAVGVAVLLIGFLFVGEVTRKAQLAGVLVASPGNGAAPLQVLLLAPPGTVGLLRPDQPVLLRYEAFGPQSANLEPGRILNVARTPEASGNGASCAGFSGAASLYRVTATLGQHQVFAHGKPQVLSAGMCVEAEVQLDRRRLIDWMFAPGPGST